MKKLLLTTAAIAALSGSAVAHDCCGGNTGSSLLDGLGYVAVEGGWSKLLNNRTNSTPSIKLASNNTGFFGVRVGYNASDDARIDLSYHFFANKKYTGRNAAKTSLDSDIHTLLVNGYYDLFGFDVAKLYVGAGVGISFVDGKLRTTSSSNKLKTRAHFAYQLQSGVSTEIASGVNVELSYSWRHFAEKNSIKVKNVGKIRLNNHLMGNNVALGLRFDI